MKRTFSIIHPSRMRPKRAYAAAMLAIKNIGEGVSFEYIVSIDKSDETRSEYYNLFCQTEVKLLLNENTSAIEAINNAAKESTGDVIIVLSDDFDEMPENWGKIILQATEGKANWLLKTHDGQENYIVTLPIMDRAYYNQFGYVYYPAYRHMFADTDMTNVGEYLNKLIIRNDIFFKHNHYTRMGNKDVVNEKNDHTWTQGENLYLNRFLCDFELKTGTYQTFNESFDNTPHIEWVHKNITKHRYSIPEYGITMPIGTVNENKAPKLSILIATTLERSGQLQMLLREFDRQIDDVEVCNVLLSSDNKEMSIGAKRQGLIEKANEMGSKWVVFFDDDDFPYHNYLQQILNAITFNDDIDCIGINGTMTTNSMGLQDWCHRIIYPEWLGNGMHKVNGWDYIRPIMHFNPVLTEKAIEAKYTDERFGEDVAYSYRLKPLLSKEYFIESPAFHYRYCDNQPHNQKYGIQ